MVDIVSVSIYNGSQRVKLCPDSEGRFLIPNHSKISGVPPLIKVTAVGLVTHPKIKHMDPVLSLSDGTKLRVYQGGDPSGMIVMAISLCEKHDKKHEKKILPVVSKKKKTVSVIDMPREYGGYVDDYTEYPWADPSLYDDPD